MAVVAAAASGGSAAAAAMSWRRGGGAGADGVARRWVLLLCVGSFCLGLLFTNRYSITCCSMGFDRLPSVLTS